MKIRVSENQNIIDVCLTQYGSIEPLFDLVNENGLSSIDYVLQDSDVLEIDETLIGDAGIVNFYDKNSFIVTTSDEIRTGDFNNDFNNDFFND